MPELRKDNRWSIRQSPGLDVGLYSGGQLPFTGRMRDIGAGGMYVRTSTDRVEQGAQIFVSFQAGMDGEILRHRIATRVVRIDRDGIGLAFDAFSEDDINTLRDIIDTRYRHVSPPGIRDES
jgi:c-di-GMP-binding flagellar brake protein YcgR